MSFSPHRRLGVGSTMHFLDDNLRWYNGVYSGKGFTDMSCNLDDTPGMILNSRVTGTPVFIEDEEGDLREVVHVGGSTYWFLAAGDNCSVKLRARPTVFTGSMQYLLTGTIPIYSNYNVEECEFVWQKDGFGLVNENFVGNYGGCGTAWATTLIARCFLGEGNYRTYSKEGGGFAAAHLANNIGKSEGNTGTMPDHWGEWEAVAMYEHADMTNLRNISNATYGKMDEYVVGLNWWWTPDLRWTTSWTHAITNSAKSGTAKTSKSTVNTLDLQMSVQY